MAIVLNPDILTPVVGLEPIKGFGDLTVNNFSIDSYKNKYLDGEGLQKLWQRTKEQIAAAVVKIIPINLTENNSSITITSSSTVEADKLILETLESMHDADIMIQSNNQNYYYSHRTSESVGYWINVVADGLNQIKVELTWNSDSTAVTQAKFTKSKVASIANNAIVEIKQKNTTSNDFTITKADGSTATVTYKPYISSPNSGGTRYFVASDLSIVGSTSGGGVLSYDTETATFKNDNQLVNITGNAATADALVTAAGVEVTPEDLVAIAEGKTKAYTISATSYTENSVFNSTDETITLSKNQSIKTVEGTSISIGALKKGDIIFLTDNDLPDRWVSVISKDTVGFNAVEGKVDLSSYQTKLAKTGDLDKPIYVSAAGTISECSKYAGGTSITLNGANEAGKAVTFYAPITLGNAGTILKVNSDKTGFTYDTECNPTSHAVVDPTYGGASDTLYGHVKLVRGDVDDYNSKNETVGKALAADAYHTHSNYIRKTVSSGTYAKTISDVQDSFTITIKNNNVNQTVFKQAENYFNLWVKGQDSKPSQDWKFLSSGKIIRTVNNSTTYEVIDSSMTLTTKEIDTILANS